MQYTVEIIESEEGFSVSCPGLPGCWSQGKTRKVALENIADAIKTYLETVREITKSKETEFVEVAIT